MIFHKINKQFTVPALKIDNIEIERVKCFNLLGVTINEQLTWKTHTDIIANKILRIVGIINKLKHFIPIEVRILLYNTLILPHLNYGILSWGFNPGRLEKLQKRAIRVVANAKYNSHTEPLFKKLQVLKLCDLVELNELKFYFKYCNNKLPFYLSSIPITTNLNIHNHNTRTSGKLHLYTIKHEFAKYCLRNHIPTTINKQPTNIISKVNTHSYHGFKIYIKRELIEKYNETCLLRNCYVCSKNN